MPMQLRGLVTLLQVFDMPTSVRFYRDLLGFQIVQSSGDDAASDWMLLRRDGIELMLNTAFERHARPASPSTATRAAHRDTGLFFACDNVDAVYRELTARGAQPTEPVVREYGMQQVYLDDPDGYQLCFQCPGAPPPGPA